MGFKEAVRTCMKEKYVTFSGRASRSEYWWFVLFYILTNIVLAASFFVFGGISLMNTGEFSTLNGIVLVIWAVVILGFILPYLSVYVRRFHDRDLSGWWVLAVFILGLIPYVGMLISIAALVITCLKGTEGENRFGEDPLNPSSGADVFA